MVPYYLAFLYGDPIKNADKSEYYYKVASMQDDTPPASKFLAVLAKASAGDHIQGAMTFLLIANSGYDTSPFTCNTLAKTLFAKINSNIHLSEHDIQDISNQESELKDSHDKHIPESYASTNCYDSIERGIKQIYLAYITDVAEKEPSFTKGSELLKNNILSRIPTIQSQSGYTVIKKDGIWEFAQ